MPVGETEGVEVVSGRLDLAAVDDLVAEAEEEVLDVAADERGRMQRSARPQLELELLGLEQSGREGHVDALGRESLRELGAGQFFLPRREGRLDRLADGIER